MDGGGGGGGGRPRDHLTAQGALLEEKRLSQTRTFVCLCFVLCCVVLCYVLLCSCCCCARYLLAGTFALWRSHPHSPPPAAGASDRPVRPPHPSVNPTLRSGSPPGRLPNGSHICVYIYIYIYIYT